MKQTTNTNAKLEEKIIRAVHVKTTYIINGYRDISNVTICERQITVAKNCDDQLDEPRYITYIYDKIDNELIDITSHSNLETALTEYYKKISNITTEIYMPDCDYIIENILEKRLKPSETKIELETIKEIIESLKNNIQLASEFTSHEWLNAIRAFQKAEKIILTYKLNIDKIQSV